MGKKLFRFASEAAKRPDKKGEAWGDPLALEAAGQTETADRMRALMTRDYNPDQLAVLRELTGSEGAARYEDKVVTINEVVSPSIDMLKVISEQTGLRLVELKRYPRADLRLRALISPEWAKTLRVVPVEEREDGTLVIAIADPSNPTIADDLRLMLAREVETVIADEDEIDERIEAYYGMGGETITDILEQNAIDEGGVADENVLDGGGANKAIALDDLEKMANDGPIVKLVNLLLLRAIQERASDVHVEPFPTFIRIRYRVDGVLREIPAPPRSQLIAIVSRIKVMANMNISESRLPQDGRIKLTADGREIDMRCSTAPTVHGEAIVMRVLDKNMAMIGISKIGMLPEVLDEFKKLIKRPNGVVLVTGPTGSGKTTTLYAAMAEVRDPGEKLITTEDPVEYELEGIQQVNINEAVGLTFGRCLRAILRQDPDTVLVGEIRDVETAQIAVQAALTGHLVFSTLHTNSAAATVTRLLDMGVEPFLITSAMQGVIGQRLVRTICQACKRPYEPTEDELEGFGVTRAEIQDQGITFFHGEGCAECSHSGYHGRMGIYELLVVTDEMREAILERATTDEIQELALRNGMVTMRQDGWVKACMGLTTLGEIARQTPREDNAPLPPASEVEHMTPPEMLEEQHPALPAQPAGQIPAHTGGIDLNTEAAMPARKAGDAAPTHR